MPTFRSLKKIVIPSRSRRFLEFLEQFLTPTPSREKAAHPINLFFNPNPVRSGIMGVLNEFFTPRARRHGFMRNVNQFFIPEPPRRGILGVINAFLEAPVYRLDQSRNIIRPRQRNANFLQRFISSVNEFLNARTNLQALARPDTILEVPSDAFKDALDNLVAASKLRIGRLVDRLENGQITPREFATLMRREVRRISVAGGIIGIRGLGNVTPQAVTAIVEQTATEIRRLNTFLQNTFVHNLNIPVGRNAGLSTAQFRQYSMRFGSAGRATSVIAQAEMLQSLYGASIEIGGVLYGRRVSPSDDRSCEDCISWTELGWLSVPETGGPALPSYECECTTNCRCYLEFAISNSSDNLPDDIAY